jgi:fluoride ion exporter CrcB/FEX
VLFCESPVLCVTKMEPKLLEVGAIVIGASAGALCRWAVVDTKLFSNRPYIGILLVNGVGSCLLGGLASFHLLKGVNPTLYLL